MTPTAEKFDLKYVLNWHTDNPLIGAAMSSLNEYVVVHDPDIVIAAWACAVSVTDADAEPLWLMLVGPPSGSKTETIKTLSQVWDEQFSEITTAGLISQSMAGSRIRPPTGLLVRLGDGCNAFVTISDMSSMLTRGNGRSGSETNTVLDALREIYDGQYERIMNGVSPRWEGRITFLAGATPAIDTYRSHADALGPRWVYIRMVQQDDEAQEATIAKVQSREGVDAARARTAELVATLVQDARERIAAGQLTDSVRKVVGDAARLTAYGRVTVPRDQRGDVSGEATWEEPARIAHQLMRLARALTALNVGDQATERIVRRAAVSCVPPERIVVLRHLAALDSEDWQSTNKISHLTDRHYRVTQHALQDVQAAGLLEVAIGDTNGLPVPGMYEENTPKADTRPRLWRLYPERRQLVETVLG